ncbi:unnamed protein product [Ilex paraguariensis]|uniref:Peptidyl-prolyl cis-trans isomerase n=1 Tax=Ilex paraguariensis TaxID=185542 RepID=A0ABC8TZM7_9AQUA
MSVLIVTSLGDMVLDLHTDLCPLTCKNFLKLCKMKYYNGCLFHTVQKDFTAQTGDPTGTGSSGDSIYKLKAESLRLGLSVQFPMSVARFFSDEIRLDLKHSKMGTVSMASAGENLNASQFYITLRDDLDYLDGKHTVFGEIAEGFETLNRINEAYVDEKGRPYKNIRIKHTYVLDDPFDDPSQLVELIPDVSPEGKPKEEVDDDVRLEDDWVPMDEQLGTAELEEVLRSKDAHSSAVVLESIGDIPDAEIKPPDNVLFVCKLNPVTEDEDLNTIFSRFGTVTLAEIIRDYKTGDSLCYAFIEFEDKEACEQAYFKMDNALIDDRRIHVDFSQSVSKLWSQYRRKDNKMGKGSGCFKCGSLDHIAKDCTGDPTIKQQPPKYILKHDNTQHGGDNNSRYEMVFDGDDAGSPRRNKRHRNHEGEGFTEKQHVNRQSPVDLKEGDQRKRVSRDSHKRPERSKEQVEDERYRGSRTSPSASRHSDYRDGDYRKRNQSDYRRKTDNSSHEDRRDEGEYARRRYADDVGRGDGRAERDYRKRSADNDTTRSLRDDPSHRKVAADSSRQDRRDEVGDRKTRADIDGRKGSGEERDYIQRSTKGGDGCDRDHDRVRARDKRP